MTRTPSSTRPAPGLAGSSREDRLTFRGNARSGRHGWLRLTPAYSLHLVREILAGCGPHDRVLDPFSGTGTTPLLCATLGIRADSVDINPFLVWLGNLKLRRFTADEITTLVQSAGRVISIASRSPSRSPRNWVPPIHQIAKWWDPPVLRALAGLFAALPAPAGSDAERDSPGDLLRVAFCRVLIEHAHVSFGHQSMSFQKRPATPEQALLASGGSRAASDVVLESFRRAVADVVGDVLDDPPRAPATVLLGDARALESVLHARRYTTVVTSPPYPNRMSYIRELRPYMYWLGHLADGRRAGELDWQAIGGTWGCATSNLAHWKPDGCTSIPHPKFERIVAAIGKDHALLGRYVHKYFEDVQRHVLSLKRVLAPSARCHYVVGNSKFYGTLLPVEELYCAIFEDAGFESVGAEILRKRSSKKELFEFIVRAVAPRASRTRHGERGSSA